MVWTLVDVGYGDIGQNRIFGAIFDIFKIQNQEIQMEMEMV